MLEEGGEFKFNKNTYATAQRVFLYQFLCLLSS